MTSALVTPLVLGWAADASAQTQPSPDMAPTPTGTTSAGSGGVQTQGASTTPSAGAPQGAAQDAVVKEVVVRGARDLAGVVQARDSSSAFGLDKAIVDTPRSVTSVSDQLLSRYDIRSVYDFTAVAAGTYTGSYFGVPGSLNVRGTIADNYFNGFLQITNFANYPTPVDASSNIEIVKGPPSPMYGPGQIGGFLNFIPKSARGENAKYLDQPEGAASIDFGSYNEREVTGEFGAPVNLLGHQGGVYAYGEIIDSDSFYIGQHPKAYIAQGNYNTEWGQNWTFDATFQFITSNGYLKDIGWNRPTQALINTGAYTAGQALTQIVTPGAAFITPAAYAATCGATCNQFVLPLYHVFGTANQYTELNPATVHTVQLSLRRTALTPLDVNDATTPLLYLGVTRELGDAGSLKLESYTQYATSKNYQGYGFATIFQTFVNEQRLTYHIKHDFSPNLQVQANIGGNYRITNAVSRGSLNSNVGSQDRYDLSAPITPDEIFNDPFLTPGGYDWNNNAKSQADEAGLFGVFDVLMFQHIDITAGARGDHYEIRSVDRGPASDVSGEETERTTVPSYNISASLPNRWIVPYYTYAKSYSLNVDQGDAIVPDLVLGDDVLGESILSEAGAKTSQFGGRLFASIAAYRQRNEYLDARTFSVSAQLARGIEGEFRYLVTKQFGVTSNITFQQVKQVAFGDGGDGPYLVLTPTQAGLSSGALGYGGQYGTLANFLGLSDGYFLHTTPRFVYSLFGTYDERGLYGFTGGMTYNSWTGGSLPGSIKLPHYILAKLGAYVILKGVRADFTVDNAFDKRYFIAEYDVDSNATVLPGVGRTFHFKLSYKFR